MNNKQILPTIFVGGALIVMGVLLADIVRRTGGIWYTLDDPYIHLRLSELIREGGYGVNRGEYAAPSSSILFPLLLAPAAHFSFHLYVPLLLNILATCFSVYMLAVLMASSSLSRSALLVNAFLMLAACFSLNLFGVVFTGLEHSLHIAASVGIVSGLIKTRRDERVPTWLLVLIVICPLLRFEGTALSAVALVLLFVDGYRRAALAATAVLVGIVALWAWFMRSHGLPLLPSSVLIKSPVAAGALAYGVTHGWRAALGSMRLAWQQPEERGVVRLAVATFCALAIAMWLGDRKIRVIAVRLIVVVAGSVAAHLFAGKYGGFARYELYIKFICATAVVWALFGEADLLAKAVLGLRSGFWRPRLTGSAGLLLWAAGIGMVIENARASRELDATLRTPLAAHNIYVQQGQMARFAQDYVQGPVAVNDIGLVSYRNENYVLDLFGQGSEEARSLREHIPRSEWAAPGGWMEQTVRRHDVQLVMIYDLLYWFPAVPRAWCRLGSLELLDEKVTPFGSQVAFFGTDAAAAARLRPLLQRFAARLPSGSRFAFTNDSNEGACEPQGASS